LLPRTAIGCRGLRGVSKALRAFHCLSAISRVAYAI
jgi:hypothetical protein